MNKHAGSERNLTLVMDLYELTMAYNYFKQGNKDQLVYFDMFYRKNPDNGGFAVFAGLQQLIECIKNLHFSEGDIEYLRSLQKFDEDFLDYLLDFKFTGSIYAMKEGTPVFPNEPLITVKAKFIEAQIIETMLLVTVNHQSLIATKAHRVVQEAKGRPVMEFGARRAQGYDSATYGARAAYIGGVAGTATVSAGEMFDIPVVGTMAHSFVQSFDSEYEAFKAYALTYPDDCVLLVDTYDTLKSGVPHAIEIAKEVLEPMGKKLKGIRLDSGDISYLSKRARAMLDVAGLTYVSISASNSLDEYLIRSLLNQGAQLDSFGVGENLIVSKSSPVFGGVYKLVAIEKNGQIIPKIKISENTEKITNPGYKRVYRLFENETGKAIADLIAFYDEEIDCTKDLTIYHQSDIWKFKTIEANTYTVEELQVPIFEDGKFVYQELSVKEIRDYSMQEKARLWDEIFRLEFPHNYYVDLTKNLLDFKIKNVRRKEKIKMARFDRKVERTKKSFEFTQKEKIVETNKDVFKKNFTFKWVQLNIKTVCVFLVDFLLVTLLIIPFMMQYLNATLAFVLGHGIITSLVIVFTGFLINKEKIKAVPFISRFLFMFILLGASSALSMAITSWLN